MDKEKIGRYEILEKLGQGAMGIVYKALDPLIGRVVALKTMTQSANLPEESKKEYVERFFREAKAAGALQHQNIVTIYDMGIDDGIPFIAMEYIDGKSLSKLLEEKGKLEIEDAVNIILQVAEGLHFAHEKGIVHRDIKPDNILIDRNGRAVITDFGIAHLTESNLTKTGEVLGTPYFMSPEQILDGKIDRRSDIFSLGVVFYLMLTGKRPFKGETISSICYHIVHSPPSEIDRNELKEQSLMEILSKMLEKDKDRRYKDCAELIEDLKRIFQRGEGVKKEVVSKPLESVETNRLKIEEKEEKRKGSYAFLIVLTVFSLFIFLGILLGGGYYLYKKNVLFPREKEKETKKVDENVITPPIIDDLTKEKQEKQELQEVKDVKKETKKQKEDVVSQKKEKSKDSKVEEQKLEDKVIATEEKKQEAKPAKVGVILETKISEMSFTFYIDNEEKVREAFQNENGVRFAQEFKIPPGEHDFRVVVQATKFPPFIREGNFKLNLNEGMHEIIKIEPARKPTPKLTIKKIDSQTGKSTVIFEK